MKARALEHDLTAARKNARTDQDAEAIAWAQDELERLRAVFAPYVPFGRYLIGPNPQTGEPNSWLYRVVPLSPDENEAAEKKAARIFNS